MMLSRYCRAPLKNVKLAGDCFLFDLLSFDFHELVKVNCISVIGSLMAA